MALDGIWYAVCIYVNIRASFFVDLVIHEYSGTLL